MIFFALFRKVFCARTKYFYAPFDLTVNSIIVIRLIILGYLPTFLLWESFTLNEKNNSN